MIPEAILMNAVKPAIDNLINRINKQVQETDNFIKEQKMFLQAKLK